MKTREEIADALKPYSGWAPGAVGISKILLMMLEVLIDIRDALIEKK